MEHESRLAETLLQVSYVVDPAIQTEMPPLPSHVVGAVDVQVVERAAHRHRCACV